MTTYIDPATALSLARTARADDIAAAEQYHLHRTLRPDRPSRRRRIPWRLVWHRPAVAH